MNEQVQINDGLVNVLANLGTGRDKASHATYAFNQKSPQELLAAYRSSWLPRKVVDIPALDSTRRWRSWNADKDQITAIEAVEKRLELQRKTRDLIIAGRLYGGAALYISTGNVNVHKPFNPEREVIRHLTLIPKQMLLPVRNLFDIDSPNFGQPELYSINNGTKQVEVHHTRLVRWIGASVPATDVFEHDGWGDSVLTALFDAVSQSDATAANIASLVYEAKVDILHIPRLMELIKTPQGEQQVRAYLHTIMAAKSTNGALVLDGGDTSQPEGKTGGVRYDSKTQSFSGLDSIWDRMLQAVAGAADIPATRLLGQSPAGLNATGESDLRNYYDRIQSIQELDIQPAMALVDQAIVREATGGPMDDIYYNWRSLWQTTDKEQAELGKITVGIITEMKETGLWPDEVLAEAGSNALIETGAVPGLEAALDEWVGGGSEISDEPDLTQPVERASPELRVVGDATPRPLYVRRNVLNGEEILRWAKSQGFGKTLTADDLHVTIAYSRQPVDWMQMGESWADRLEVAAGGPRVVERFGDATVLLFACSELEWRHESFKGKGASWDHPEYQPHITISYDAGDLEAIKPYTGKIVLGPEIFEPIEEGFKARVVGDVKPYMSQPRAPAGQSDGGQWTGGPSQSNYGPKLPEGGGQSSSRGSANIAFDANLFSDDWSDHGSSPLVDVLKDQGVSPRDLVSSLVSEVPGEPLVPTLRVHRGAIPLISVRVKGEKGFEIHRMLGISNGELIAYHESFKIPGEYQGRGISKATLARSMDFYKKIGVSRIDLEAGLSAGGYVWAKFGFRPINEDAWAGAKTDIKKTLMARDLKDVKRKWEAPGGPLELGSSSRRLWDIADSAHGKDALAGVSWQGTLRLSDEEAMSRFGRYVGVGK